MKKDDGLKAWKASGQVRLKKIDKREKRRARDDEYQYASTQKDEQEGYSTAKLDETSIVGEESKRLSLSTMNDTARAMIEIF